MRREHARERLHIVVWTAHERSPRELRTGVETGVRKFIEHHEVWGPNEGRNNPCIHQVSTTKYHGIFGLMVSCQRHLKRAKEAMVSRDEAARARTRAVLLGRRHRSRHNVGIVRERQQIVAAKI